jgi:hypothetical protein
MRLTASFPARVRATDGPTFEGTVTVINDSGRRVEGLAASRPDVTVRREGRIVAGPLPRDEVGLQLDLAPGARRELAAAGRLPLAPGRYEIHAVLPIAGEEPAAGGPWSLEVV